MYVNQAKIETQEGFLKSFENQSIFGKLTSKNGLFFKVSNDLDTILLRHFHQDFHQHGFNINIIVPI